jgi:protein disulfide-isomerase
MNRRTWASGNVSSAAVLIGIVLLLAVVYLWAGRAPASDVAWFTDIEVARTRAAERNQPIMLYFTADWCPPCKQMARDVWPDERVERTVNDGVVPVYIDVDDQPDLAERFEVARIPTLIFADAAGRTLRHGNQSLRGSGRFDAAGIAAWVELANESIRSAPR